MSLHPFLICFALLVVPVQAKWGGRETGTLILAFVVVALFVTTLVMRYIRWQNFQITQRVDVKQLDAPIQGVPQQRRKNPQRRGTTTAPGKKPVAEQKRGSLGMELEAGARRRSVELQQIHDQRPRTSAASDLPHQAQLHLPARTTPPLDSS